MIKNLKAAEARARECHESRKKERKSRSFHSAGHFMIGMHPQDFKTYRHLFECHCTPHIVHMTPSVPYTPLHNLFMCVRTPMPYTQCLDIYVPTFTCIHTHMNKSRKLPIHNACKKKANRQCKRYMRNIHSYIQLEYLEYKMKY